MNDELGDLLEPIVLDWTVDKLDDWVKRYGLNNNLSIGLRQSKATGTIHITLEWAGGNQNAIIVLDADPPGNGPIRLIPYLNDAASASAAAVADLRRLRDALESAANEMAGKEQPQQKPPTQFVSAQGIASGAVFGPAAITVEPDGVVTDRLLEQAEKNEEQARQLREQAKLNLARMMSRAGMSLPTATNMPVAQTTSVANEVLAANVWAAETLQAIEDMTLGVTLKIRAAYAEMLALLAAILLRDGTSVIAAWNESDNADGLVVERRFELSSSGHLTMSGSLTAEVIKGELSVTEEDDKLSANGQVIGLSTIASSLALHPPEVVGGPASVVAYESAKMLGSARPNWDLTIDKDHEGVRSVHFVARDSEARAKLAAFVELASSVMNGEKYDQPLLSSATSFAISDSQKVNKRGKRGSLSKAEKLKAVEEWDAIDKDFNPIRLDDWLERRFGTDNGVLRVAVSTFHSWRKHRDSP